MRGKVKVLIVKMSLGLLTAAVIGMIVKQEMKVIDEVEARYLPPKQEKEEVL